MLYKVFTKWQWEQTSFSHFRTPFGDLDLLFHGEHTGRQIMRLSWQMDQMVLSFKEPRIIQDAPDLQSKVYVLTTHQAWLKSGNHQQICTALGAGNDAHKLAKKLEKDICCPCGRCLPSRHHLTWHCPESPVPGSLIHPVHSAEEKLLLRAITKPPLMSRMPQVRVACNQLNNHIRTLPAQTVIACDGRMISRCDQARAAWAVDTAHACFGAPSPGLDQHIHSAEAWALLVALRAADPTPSRFFKKPWRVRVGGALPRFAPGLWKEVSFLSLHSMLHFVPSHGMKSFLEASRTAF